MTGQPDMQWMGIGNPWEGCGTSLTNCGDINGDGVDDIMFGSYQDEFNPQGCVDIWKGSTQFVVNVPPGISKPLPQSFRLLPPYPNPFNSSLTIPFEVTAGTSGGIHLKIYNVLGQEVADLTKEARQSLLHHATRSNEVFWYGKDQWGKDCGTGIYFVTLRVAQYNQVQKVVLLR